MTGRGRADGSGRRDVLAGRLAALRKELGGAGLVAVSKRAADGDVELLRSLGQRDFGESRVQDLALRAARLRKRGVRGIRWHFVGPLQSNKAARLLDVEGLAAVHSVGSARTLGRLLARGAGPTAPAVDIFLQVRAGEGRNGFAGLDELREARALFPPRGGAGPGPGAPAGLRLAGLMAMAPRPPGDGRGDPARAAFLRLRSLRDRLDPALALSMGMSGDYRTALACGADVVRVGSLLFEGGDGGGGGGGPPAPAAAAR